MCPLFCKRIIYLFYLSQFKFKIMLDTFPNNAVLFDKSLSNTNPLKVYNFNVAL